MIKKFLPIVFLLILFIPTAQAQVSNLPLCSAAVHDAHTKTGPDGSSYTTWHPQIDEKNNCRYDHEHGSSPALFIPSSRKFGGGLWPLYNYSASKHGMSEPHNGFKTYVFEAGGYRWMVTNHFGTGNAVGAACNQFHTVDIAALNSAGVLVLDTHFMGNFGISRDNVSGAALTPPACPNQGSITGTTGARRLPVQTSGPVMYEPWSFDLQGNVLGFSAALGTFNTPNAQTVCNDLTCSANVATGNNGALRFMVLNSGFGFTSGPNTGTFWTNAHATTVLSSTDPGAVQQYVAPGLAISLPLTTCKAFDAHAYIYGCAGATPDEDMFKLNPLITGAN